MKLKNKMKQGIFIFQTFMGIVFIVLLICLVVPHLLGLESYTVLSDSMGKTIPVGSLLYVQKCGISEVRINDVATFLSKKNPENSFTHRIIAIDVNARTFITKGDANKVNDPLPISADLLVGKVVWVIPFAGLLSAWMGNYIFVLGMILLGVLIIATEISLKRDKTE